MALVDDISPEKPPVILVSAESPGCGSSSLCRGIGDRVRELFDQDPYIVSVGQLLRNELGVSDETELQEKLASIPDPKIFDPQIYGKLPEDRVVVVDGKLATTYGPLHIQEDRPIISIDVSAPTMISARRILEREGCHIGDDSFPDRLLETLKSVQTRRDHDVAMRDVDLGEAPERSGAHMKINIDTSRYSQDQVVDTIFPREEVPDEVSEWELEALKDTFLRLQELSYRGKRSMRAEDQSHFDHHMEAITYNIERLQTTTNSGGLDAIRKELRNSLIDSWYGLMMKKTPRFYSTIGDDGEEVTVLDDESMAWSPEFYKIAEGWPTIKSYLQGKSILDPYAGSGEMMNLLVARGIVSSAVLADIKYTLNEEGVRYNPALNSQAGVLLFDRLPSWYRPNMSPIKGYVAGDSRKLPFRDESFDFVFGDPPYGKNHKGAGIGTLLGSIEELKRVCTEGVILLVPEGWIEEIESAGHSVEKLTNDLSRGQSNYPVQYIKINK